MRLFFALCLFFVVIATPVFAAEAPVEISATQSLEWDRKAKTYTARGDVIATQGNARVESDLLVARYTDTDGSGVSIKTLEAEKNVSIHSSPYVARGDRAIYTVATGHAVLTGSNLSVTTGNDTLTAKEKIEFFGRENRLTARGAPQVSNGRDVITADTMSAIFAQDSSGKRRAEKFTAEGNVTVKTPRETITGDAGVYNVITQKAVLTGKVMIRQGDSWIEGRRANIDMQTGISQLLGTGNAETGGRVRGVFYPGGTKTDNESSDPQQSTEQSAESPKGAP